VISKAFHDIVANLHGAHCRDEKHIEYPRNLSQSNTPAKPRERRKKKHPFHTRKPGQMGIAIIGIIEASAWTVVWLLGG
jgi:hypothetical protein